MNGIIPAGTQFPYPTIQLKRQDLIDLTEAMMNAGVVYGLGCKAPRLTDAPGSFDAVDCSGFIRWILAQATDQVCIWVDGSDNQHQQAKRVGFKVSSVEAAKQSDGYIRIAFLAPGSTSEGIGHVVLILGDGYTAESHGHHGPDRRVWDGTGWQSKCEVFVLTTADQAA